MCQYPILPQLCRTTEAQILCIYRTHPHCVTPRPDQINRRQVDPRLYKSNAQTFRTIRAAGIRGVFTGWSLPSLATVQPERHYTSLYYLYWLLIVTGPKALSVEIQSISRSSTATWSARKTHEPVQGCHLLASQCLCEFTADVALCPRVSQGPAV